MTCHSAASAVRLSALLLVISASLVGAAPVGGEEQPPIPVPGRNSNLGSGPAELVVNTNVNPPVATKVRGDFLLKQDNEGSCTRGSRNSKNILCGGNDYGLVDAPGIDPDDVVRDAGAGVYQSADGGDTWESTMLAGHVLDAPGSGPLRNGGTLKNYKAFADITARSGAAGIAYMSGIAFKSTNNTSIGYLATFLELNNQENVRMPFTHLHTVKFASVPETLISDPTKATSFVDKPWSVVLPPSGAMCSINVPHPDGTGVIPQVIPDSPVLIGYTVFANLEKDPNLMVTFENIVKVTNCGRNVGFPRVVSVGHRQNGISLAVSPVPGSKRVVAAWRRFASQIGNLTFTDAILAVVSNDSGNSWSLPRLVANICPFQQSSTAFTARINTFPTIAIDHKPQGRITVAWSDRLRGANGACLPEGQSRIVVSNSTNGTSWSAPVIVGAPGGPGHQITPSLTYGGGTLLLLWKDLRETQSRYFDGFINEFPLLQAAAANAPPPPPNTKWMHHTIELYSRMANVDGATLQWGDPVRISQYKFGKSASDMGPDSVQKQWEIINLRLFQRAKKVFDGDYADAAGPPMLPPDPTAVPARSNWTLDTGQTGDPSFYGVWTSNRDVRRVAAHTSTTTDANGNALEGVPYTPPGLRTPIRPDSAGLFTACTPGATTDFSKTMDQNLYGAPIGLGTSAFSPGNNKQAFAQGSDFQRAFVVTVRNDSADEKTYRFSIPLAFRNPLGGAVAFTQFPTLPVVTEDEATRIVMVAPKSTASRTVFIIPDNLPLTTLDPNTRARVDIVELVGGPLGIPGDENASVYINADPTAPEIEAPEIEAREIYTPEIEAAEITVHAAPEIEAPEIEAPEIEAPEIEAPEIEAKSFQTPEIEAPEIEAPEIEAPEIEAPEIEAAAITDVTWPVENTGNTAAGYIVRPTVGGDLSDFDFQLVVSRIVRQQTAKDCEPTFSTMNKVALNIKDAKHLVDPAAVITPEELDNATIWVAPQEHVFVTLRVRGDEVFNPVNNPTVLTVTQQAIDTTLLQAGVTEPPTFRGLPTGVVGEFYSAPLVATFGTPPYTWTVAEGSTLPPGLALENTEGGWMILGTPTTAGTFDFTLRVQDSTLVSPQVQFIRFRLTIVGPLNIVTTSVPGGFVGRPYSFTPQVTGGARPYSFSLGESSLPAGLTLNEFTGEISGTPTMESDGPNDFELCVEDAAGSFECQSLAITVMDIGVGDLIVADGAVDFEEPTGSLWMVSPDGEFYSEIATFPGHPISVVQEASGSLLIADPVRNGIFRVTPDHEQTVRLGAVGAALDGAVGLAITPAGQIIVGDNATDKVYRLAPDGSRITEIASLPSSPSNLQSVSIVGHPSGDMYVANGDTSGVTLFRISPTEVVTPITITNPNVEGPIPTTAGDMAVDNTGNLVIADFGSSRIFRLTTTGSVLAVFDVGDGMGTNMSGIDVESSGAYVVSVNFANAVRRVVIFEGGPIVTTVIAGPDEGTAPLVFPNDVIIFRNGGG